MLNLLTTVSLSLFSPQVVPEPPASPQMRYVDFSHDLERPGVTAMVGRLGKLKKGKRERIKAGGRLGGKASQTSVSGTQYYKVPVRAKIVDETVLAGAKPKGKVELEFDLQIARLPNGSEHRQSMTGNGAALQDGQLALWVVEKRPKARRLALLHVIPFHPKATSPNVPSPRTWRTSARSTSAWPSCGVCWRRPRSCDPSRRRRR